MADKKADVAPARPKRTGLTMPEDPLLAYQDLMRRNPEAAPALEPPEDAGETPPAEERREHAGLSQAMAGDQHSHIPTFPPTNEPTNKPSLGSTNPQTNEGVGEGGNQRTNTRTSVPSHKPTGARRKSGPPEGSLLAAVLQARPDAREGRLARLHVDLDQDLIEQLKFFCLRNKVTQRQVIHALLTELLDGENGA